MLTRTLMTSAAILALFAAPVSAQQSPPGSQPTNEQKVQPPSTTQPAASQPTTSNQPVTTTQPVGKSAGSTQPRVRTVTGTSLPLDFYTVGANDIRASDLMGMNVYNLNNESVGKVEDLIFDNGKNVKGIVISVGSFLGLGGRNVAVQSGSVLVQRQADGSERAVINTTKETLQNAPEFKFEARKQAGNQTTGANGASGANTSTAPASKSAPASK